MAGEGARGRRGAGCGRRQGLPQRRRVSRVPHEDKQEAVEVGPPI